MGVRPIAETTKCDRTMPGCRQGGAFTAVPDLLAKKTTKIFGVLLQDQNYGAGFFMRGAGSGKVKLDPTE